MSIYFGNQKRIIKHTTFRPGLILNTHINIFIFSAYFLAKFSFVVALFSGGQPQARTGKLDVGCSNLWLLYSEYGLLPPDIGFYYLTTTKHHTHATIHEIKKYLLEGEVPSLIH